MFRQFNRKSSSDSSQLARSACGNDLVTLSFPLLTRETHLQVVDILRDE
jgi:hypothetical protein